MFSVRKEDFGEVGEWRGGFINMCVTLRSWLCNDLADNQHNRLSHSVLL